VAILALLEWCYIQNIQLCEQLAAISFISKKYFGLGGMAPSKPPETAHAG
jgi:hypothetical protein